MRSSSLLAAGIVGIASAANFDVKVGPNLAFTPNDIRGSVNDTVTFKFSGATHDVTQSTFDDPCNYKTGGIITPQVSSSSTSFMITLNNTDPIYFFCSVPSHCGGGGTMVGVINSATGQTASDFMGKAKAASGSSAPSVKDAVGGVLGNGGSSSASGTSSGSASATGSGSSSSPTSGAAMKAAPGVVGILAAALAMI